MAAVTEISAKTVGALRERTGAPLMKCKAALAEAGGDLSRAEAMLRERGAKPAPAPEDGNQGFIAVYVHPGNQVVGMVELACATDFVARSEEFRAVAYELAMQVTASAPSAVSVEALSDEVREKEITRAWEQVETDRKMVGKPDALRQEVARRKAEKSLAERCLLTQEYIRDPKSQVGSLVDGLRLKVREDVYVRRIVRWRVGERL